MQKVISVLLAAVAVIHLLPLAGVLGPQKLHNLYGLSFDEPNLLILMRHRAVLFGLLGAFLMWSAWRPALVPLALAAGFVSVLSFLGLALVTEGYNAGIARVVMADWVALACLVVAAVLRYVPIAK